MNNQVQKPKKAFAHPVPEFTKWYRDLSLDQKLRISVDLLYAVPSFHKWFDGNTVDAPIAYLQGWTDSDYELLGRIGTLKTLIDVFLLVPSESDDVSAYYMALYSSMISKAKSLALSDDEPNLLAAKSAYEHAEKMRSDYDNLFGTWHDFSVSNEKDSKGSASPFSPRYLYRWMCQQENRDDPFVAAE